MRFFGNLGGLTLYPLEQLPGVNAEQGAAEKHHSLSLNQPEIWLWSANNCHGCYIRTFTLNITTFESKQYTFNMSDSPPTQVDSSTIFKKDHLGNNGVTLSKCRHVSTH